MTEHPWAIVLPGQLTSDGSFSQTHTHTQRGGSMSPCENYHFLLLFSLTCGLQHFLPVLQESLITEPTVSLGDLLEEVGHSSVILPLLFHLSPSRMMHSPVSILRIKEEAQLSIEAKLPGCIDESVVFSPACHPGLQGQRA